MKAMIFAAGLGTRLKPFTETAPKALFPVNGKPLLYHIIHRLKSYGFNEIIINVHHFAGLIIEYLRTEDYFGINIQLSDEQNLLADTGGGIKKASWFFASGEPFLVHNVDIISNADLHAFYQYHLQQKDPAATLMVKERETSRYLLWNEENKLSGWINTITQEVKPSFLKQVAGYKKMAFSGIHILSPSVLDYMKEWPDKFSIIDFYISILDKTNIYGYAPQDLQLVDVGKPENLPPAEKLLNVLNK